MMKTKARIVRIRFVFLNPELIFAMINPTKDAASIGISGIKSESTIQYTQMSGPGEANIPYPIIIAKETLRYQGSVCIYMYKNLHPATVLLLNGSDISMSYSLKLKRYPLVLNTVNTKPRELMTSAHIAGMESASPISA